MKEFHQDLEKVVIKKDVENKEVNREKTVQTMALSKEKSKRTKRIDYSVCSLLNQEDIIGTRTSKSEQITAEPVNQFS